jgi:hypothetical protein
MLLVLAILAGLVLSSAQSALAWKPFTHVYTGDKAWTDVTADGKVTVNGHDYAVDPTIVTALTNQRSYFNAGVIGPDGFPDLVMGQSVIHPEKTGEWLRYIMRKAWDAQTASGHGAAEREQILAFAYGFMTHAAGDMWAHTFVNDFAGGVFPSISGILNGLDDPMFAVRHLIVEGYIGDANPGYDGNPERTAVPLEQNEDGDPDWSDDQSPRISFAAPHRFIYETLVNPNAVLPFGTCGDNIDDDGDGTADDGCPGGPFTKDGGDDLNGDGEPDGDGPEPKRGKLIDFFIDMKADLMVDLAEYDMDSQEEDCAAECEGPQTFTRSVSTPRGVVTATHTQDACGDFCILDPGDFAEDVTILNLIVEPYIQAWIEDIDTLLQHWSELGLASTKALFDPGTHRDAQNNECRNKVGAESDSGSQRSLCEDGVGVLTTLDYAQGSFVNQYLLSALGAPDALGDLLDALDVLGTVFEDLLGPVLNPILAPLDELKAYIKDLIEEEIGKALGIDIAQLKSFLTSPTHWLNVGTASFTLPIVGTQTVTFFQPTTHSQLDTYMGLGTGHHGPSTTINLPGVGPITSSRLADSAVFNEATFAPFRNTVQQAKLLLLRGPGLNALLKQELVDANVIKPTATIGTYTDGAFPANVMFSQLSGSASWLRSIDGDHGWRENGLPRFCDEGTSGCPDGQVGPPTARPERLNGGEGTYPLWESCLNRPVFRSLYVDWENGASNFPDLGDTVSSDPGDASAPDPNLALSAPPGHIFTSGGTTYAAADHTLTATGTDAVFTDASVALQYRYFLASGPEPGAESGWAAIANNGTFQVTGPDGLYKAQIRAADPCHTFATGDSLPAGAPETTEFFLDATPPEITISSPPDGTVYDTDDFATITWSATDAGSGVASQSGTFDGAATSNGAQIDMFFLYPGPHTVSVSATDNVGNSATKTNTFQVQATSVSLLNNVKRACGEPGNWPPDTPVLITKHGICNALKQILDAAIAKHVAGTHAVEHNQLTAWTHLLQAQRGDAVDAATADRFIAYAEDLIARNG